MGRSPAVGANGTQVDLYGYASMAVAAIQAQAREIDPLKAEVAGLRHELARRRRTQPRERPRVPKVQARAAKS